MDGDGAGAVVVVGCSLGSSYLAIRLSGHQSIWLPGHLDIRPPSYLAISLWTTNNICICCNSWFLHFLHNNLTFPVRWTTATSTCRSCCCCRWCCCSCLLCWVKTFTCFAICGFYIISTAVSTIPFTPTIVIFIITPVVTFPLRGTTCTRTIRWGWRSRSGWCRSSRCWRFSSTSIPNFSYKRNML